MARKPPYHELEQRVRKLEQELSKLKQTEEALKKSEEQYRVIFNSATDSLLVFDADGNIVEANQQACKMYGYDYEELIQLSGKDIVHPHYYHLFEQFKADVRSKGDFYAESVDIRKDGTAFNIEVKGGMFEHKGKPHLLAVIRDITQRKQVEKFLQESEEKYRGLVENSFDGIFLQKGPKIIFANQRLCEMLGYEKDELVGLDHWHVYHPDYQDLTKERAEARMRGETVASQYEVKLQCKDGSWLYGEINARAVSFEEEPGIQVWVRDITEPRRAEKELKKRQTYLESVLYSAPDAIVTLDASHQVIEWNVGAEEIFRYTRHEAIGKNIDDLITGTDVIDESKKLTMQVLSGGKVLPRETVRYRKDGTPVNVIVAGSPIIIGDNLQGVVAVYTDITEQKKAEEALKQSEEKYRTILEGIEEGYYEVDIRGNIRFVNDSLCTILGYPRDEIIGINNRNYMDEENAKRVYQDFNKVYKTGKPTKIFDWVIVRKDGTKRHVEASVSLIKDAEGTPTGFRGMVRDITEKINLESQLLQARKMEAIGTLAGGIAHNFNNLLMSIQGNISLMLLDTSPDHPFYERLTTIEQAVHSGSKLTSQLLGYARGGSYEIQVLNINRIIQETAETFAMTRKDITLHQDLDDTISGVKADRGQIEQVLLNIYINAAEAMGEGGDLSINTRNIAHTDITTASYAVKPGTYVLITLTDTGIGMDHDTQAKIFDPFFTTKGLAKGTGLGLASVYGIIKAHGGYIDVKSRRGHGTTFFVYLPASSAAVIEERKPVHTMETGNETILLVDDEETVLTVGAEMLTSLGYTVITAGSGQEALDILRTSLDSRPPDLVILDMIMPQMGGGETCDKMKELHPPIKVLLSSGYSINGQAEEILKRGCNGFLQKPFTIKELSTAIREVVGKR